jgi:hypothetical protein
MLVTAHASRQIPSQQNVGPNMYAHRRVALRLTMELLRVGSATGLHVVSHVTHPVMALL